MELTKSQKLILSVLKESGLSREFYWTGGTLLSHYYLHHRLSFDLDFFTDKPFSYDLLIPFLTSLKSQLMTDTLTSVKVHERWEFIIEKPEQLRFEFAYYNHDKKRLYPLTTYMNISIDSLPDIAANKIIALFDRNEPKDLFDIYTLLSQKKFTPQQLLDMAERKFGIKLNEFSFWSECTKAFNKLNRLIPYLLPGNDEKGDIIAEIRNFFLLNGKQYLDEELK